VPLIDEVDFVSQLKQPGKALAKLPTGIPGFDQVANGGLPRGRTTLVAGAAGSAKTVFAAQLLAEGIRQFGEGGVFITFEESPQDIRRNMLGFGWDIAQWEAEGRWAFVDCSPQPDDPPLIVGDYDLAALLVRVEHAVKQTKASRISIDSMGRLFLQLGDEARVRSELFRLGAALKRLDVTSVLTAEISDEAPGLCRHGVEEFVSDNVVLFRNNLEQEKRRRTVEILKFRGASHQKGEFPFTVAGDGIIIIPLSAIELKQPSTSVRVPSGNEELDRMCGGGFFRDSIILVSGPTGTGKTLITTEFIAGGAHNGERCLLFAFEESHDQLFRNASGWGKDFAHMEQDGKLTLVCEYPEALTLEDHLIRMKEAIEEVKPQRVAVDSLSALERVSSLKSFREFVIGLTSYVKHREMIGLFTATTSSLLGGTSTTETHISTITDSIILLRYAEVYGEMRRGLAVLKMRGSMHDKDIREYRIDSRGMHLGKPFRNVSGILSGNFSHAQPEEIERIGRLFREEDGDNSQS
jgi:circadian clock protein KaiC